MPKITANNLIRGDFGPIPNHPKTGVSMHIKPQLHKIKNFKKQSSLNTKYFTFVRY
jgi:hypothetical protein